MGKHALCSASSAARWLACPRSAKINASLPDQTSEYAQQGTDAHSLCEYLVLKALGRKTRDPTEDLSWYDTQMQDAAEGYRDFVLEKAAGLTDPFISVEQKVDFSRWVPEGFGTCDFLAISDGVLQICDFKYGVGVVVEAEMNPQLMLYALGAWDTFERIYDVHTVRMAIYQPRRDHVSEFEISLDELLSWANDVLAPAARLACAGEGDFAAGDHCRFCKIRATCRTRAQYETDLLRYQLEDPAELDPGEIAEILGKADSLISWAGDVKEYALHQALSGTKYPGFKVVAGRTTRKYTDEMLVATTVEEAGFDPYEKKVKGITAMTQTLGKKQFEELLDGLISKSTGKPALVPESDRRPEFQNITNDSFDE